MADIELGSTATPLGAQVITADFVFGNMDMNDVSDSVINTVKA
eukprot:CAMPEP_0177587488 /NCGR_PEP_ID=MMETSP0419_2-20121207/5683_1 /TAXON_ID=582737 /ORGANISM="Tetraselmis sp., Strain GSL018" /LENGTH=42 /DNA_ID= /DNA_START= /DNA_END= /DNA_ORIENTATION=